MQSMRKPHSLTTKLALIGCAFLVLALASIGLTLWVTWQLEGGAAAVNEAGRMRMQTWRLAAMLPSTSPRARQTLVAQFDDSVALLRGGDPSRPLFVPWDSATRHEFATVEQGWRVLREAWLANPPPAQAQVNAQAERFVASIDAFVSSIEHQLSHWTAILNIFQLAMMALAIGSAVVLLYAGYIFVLDPLSRLRSGLQRVESGELGARVSVDSEDEFGELSDGFNRMTETLQSLYQSLEDKVREKTASLEVERERLSALYEASAFLARADGLDELARGFAGIVRRVAKADAVAIRWSNEGNERYLLLASEGLPEALVEGEHCLLTGSCLCGNTGVDAKTRVIAIHPAVEAPFQNCLRAGYQCLVSVPVQQQQRVIGELDLFYQHSAELPDDERSLLESLSSHLANAMEGLRATALEREAAVAEERGLLARELHDSIAQSLAFLKIQVQLLRDALRREDAVAVERVLGELDAGLRESTGDVRELLMHFRTRTNAEDIAPALRTTLQKFEHQSGLSTHLDIEGHGLPLPADVQVQVLHVLQEALSNVRKHANAREVWLSVQCAPRWRFEVRDDGTGFDAATAADETHVGQRIMRERAARIGAEVRIDSAPGRGTCVVLSLPATQSNHANGGTALAG